MHITWFPLTISPPPKWLGENKGYHRWWIRKMSCLLGGPPNNYGKRLLSQLVGSRSALDYCGNCAATTAFSKRAFAAQRVKATQVLNNFICWTTRKKKSSCLHWEKIPTWLSNAKKGGNCIMYSPRAAACHLPTVRKGKSDFDFKGSVFPWQSPIKLFYCFLPPFLL